LIEDALIIPWDNIIDLYNINDKVTLFNQYIHQLYDLHAPVHTINVGKPKFPWVNENIKNMMKLRDKLRIKFNKSNLLKTLICSNL
jgi:hypothetical protein